MKINKIYLGDCRQILRSFPEESIDLVMYSPPYYGLRDYGKDAETEWADGWHGQLGLEPNWKMYIDHMIEINREIKRVLKKSGNLYVDIGDTYHQKGLLGIPWRFAFAMIEDGWILRNAIIWYKPNHIPESVKDRLTKTYEYIFHFVKSRKYYYNLDMIRESYSISTIKRISQRNVFNQKGGKKQFLLRGEKKSERDRGSRCADMVKSIAEAYFGKYLEIEEEKLQKYYGSPRARVKRFLKGLSMIYEEMEKVANKYDSKYSENEYGQKLQGFIRGNTIAKIRGSSRTIAEKLFPNNPELQQDFINWVHDHAGNLKGKNPGDSWSIDEKPHTKKKYLGVREKYGPMCWWKVDKPRLTNPKGKNPGDFWSINTRPFPEAHFSTYPVDICLRPILSSCPPNGIVLDPMCGSGTTLLACNLINFKMWDEFRIPVNDYARKTDWNLRWIGIEINPEYVEIAMKRLKPFIHQKKLVEFID